MPTKNQSQDWIYPVILSGGAGTRLWPLSRALYPKQLLPLTSDRTMLQETVLRVADRDRFRRPTVVCNERHRFVVAEQLGLIDAELETIIVEPEGRNTAPAAALAAIHLGKQHADPLVLLLPSDHAIGNETAFLSAVDRASAAAAADALVTFGIPAARPETGYGYIQYGTPWNAQPGVYAVDRFIEKPGLEDAEAFVEAGGYAWNSGMFLFRAGAFLDELKRLEPTMFAACRDAVDRGRQQSVFFLPCARTFGDAPAKSVDYSVMEHTGKAAVVPVDMDWSDVGAWSALWDIGDKDPSGNVLMGDVLASGVERSYIRSEGRLVAAIGLEDMVLVVTDDAVLAAARDKVQDVRQIVERLGRDGREEAATHRTVYRPWGNYRGIDLGERFQAKRITVKPGAALSLQRHKHRSEHWVVVSGKARVTIGDEVFDLDMNQSAHIPKGAVHRLENREKDPLVIIEVQCGDYLGEDDIERLDDVYGRTRLARKSPSDRVRSKAPAGRTSRKLVRSG